MALTPRSVYVHVPFCGRRCGYCNFTLVADRDYLIDQYLTALEIEMSQVEGRPQVDTIYLGGGTPSRLPPKAMEYLFKLIDQRFDLTPDGEYTIEANPEDLSDDLQRTIKDSRINRVSLGIQSFHQDKLRSLDRDHSRDQIEAAIQFTRQAVDRFSIDLIYAAPFDSLDIWNSDLARGIESGATHISTYELTYEKGTTFWNRLEKGELVQANEDDSVQYYLNTIDTLAAANFAHYEISSFAKEQHRSRHNQSYWTGKAYLAFGPGASGFVSGVRYTNHRSVTRYIQQVLEGDTAIESSEQLSAHELAVEKIVFGLRRIEGIDVPSFEAESGVDLQDVVPEPLQEMLFENQLIERVESMLRLTRAGLLIADHVCSKIMFSTTN